MKLADALRRYAGALLACATVAAAAYPLQHVFDPSNIVMLFLLATVTVAVLFGRGPAVLAAVLNVLAFDWLFVPPRFTLDVFDAQYLVTFAVMLIVGVVVGQLTAGLHEQATLAADREQRARHLFEMARALSAAVSPEQVIAIGERFVATAIDGAAAVLTLGPDESLVVPSLTADPFVIDIDVARSCAAGGSPAGPGTGAHEDHRHLYLPLNAPVRTRGVLVVQLVDGRAPRADQRRMLDTCAALIAIALERVHFVDVAQRTMLDMESERLRNSVLATLSHDLRTPLTVLVGLSESLSSELARHAQATDAQAALVIRDHARRMALLVDNLLEMARLQAGQAKLRPDWQSVEELIGSALAAIGPPLNDRDVDLDVPADLPLVKCDGVLIERVLFNLIENAVKYTPPGTPVTLRARPTGHVIEVAVEDRGPGLREGQERAVFEKFTRGDSESTVPGVGLGLAICRAIVEAHGGTIRAENRNRGGARFVFTLPLSAAPPVPAETDAMT